MLLGMHCLLWSVHTSAIGMLHTLVRRVATSRFEGLGAMYVWMPPADASQSNGRCTVNSVHSSNRTGSPIFEESAYIRMHSGAWCTTMSVHIVLVQCGGWRCMGFPTVVCTHAVHVDMMCMISHWVASPVTFSSSCQWMWLEYWPVSLLSRMLKKFFCKYTYVHIQNARDATLLSSCIDFMCVGLHKWRSYPGTLSVLCSLATSATWKTLERCLQRRQVRLQSSWDFHTLRPVPRTAPTSRRPLNYWQTWSASECQTLQMTLCPPGWTLDKCSDRRRCLRVRYACADWPSKSTARVYVQY